ncbi:MAG TPA: response regulator [Albitalea sp.]|nr:response regulator [Albitalea sp.]
MLAHFFPGAAPLPPFDFAEVFADAARQALRDAQARHVAFSFDCRGETAAIHGDERALHCALHRLLCAAVDLLPGGMVMLDGEARRSRPGRLAVRVRVGGTGALASDAAVDKVLARLQLNESAASGDGERPRLRRAHGRCPTTGGLVEFGSMPAAGLLLRYEQVFDHDDSESAPQPDAGRARAWVIDPDAQVAESLVRRLQRMGWATVVFPSLQQALRRLRAMPREHARPALVVASEISHATAHEAQLLAAMLPARSGCVLGVRAGSPTLIDADGLTGVQVRVVPLSTRDLCELTEDLASGAQAGSGLTRPAPLLECDRPRLLVVDDNDINRIVASGLGESLGYDVRVACDGVEALDACRLDPPAAVLMDVSMPRMDGIEATRHLRALQRAGAVAPFPIVAATADTDPHTRQQCLESGMDAFLAKPLMRARLGGELRRLVTRRSAGSAASA